MDPQFFSFLPFPFRIRYEPGLHISTQAAQSCRGQHAFACSANTEQHMSARTFNGRISCRCHITVMNQPDAGSGSPAFTDQVLMALPVQDAPQLFRSSSVTPKYSSSR